MFDELRQGALTGLRLGLLHGRMSADDKEVTMARFKRGEIDVLVCDDGDRSRRGCAERDA